MPTNRATKRKRYLVAGHFIESEGYAVDRPAGCHDWLLIYTVRGAGELTHDGGTFRTRAHEAVLIAPNTPHRYEVASTGKPWELLWAHFLPPTQWHAWLKWKAIGPGWSHVELPYRKIRRQLTARFKELVSLAAGYRHHRQALALNSLEAILLYCHEQVEAERGRSLDSRITDVLDFICHNLDRPLGINELAKVCHLSPSRFSHLFREQMQSTPIQFIERQRIERSRELLEHSGHNISTIGALVGFENAFYFSRRFKLATGMSPREYRRSMT